MGGNKRDGKPHRRIKKWKTIEIYSTAASLKTSFLPRFLSHSAEAPADMHRQRDQSWRQLEDLSRSLKTGLREGQESGPPVRRVSGFWNTLHIF